jgi:hypothetical protein
MKLFILLSLVIILGTSFGCRKVVNISDGEWAATIPQPTLDYDGTLTYRFLENFTFIGQSTFKEQFFPFEGVYGILDGKLYLFHLESGIIETGNYEEGTGKIFLRDVILENRPADHPEGVSQLSNKDVVLGRAGLDAAMKGGMYDFNSASADSVNSLIEIFEQGIQKKEFEEISKYIRPVQTRQECKEKLRTKFLANAYSPFFENVFFDEADTPMEQRALEAKEVDWNYQVIGHLYCKFPKISHGWLIVEDENRYFFVM